MEMAITAFVKKRRKKRLQVNNKRVKKAVGKSSFFLKIL